MAIDFDQSIINYTLRLSLEDQRKDSKAKFETISAIVKCIPNNGMITDSTRKTIGNTCFFLSVYHGLNFRKVKTISFGDVTIPLTALNIFKLSGYSSPGQCVDTDDPMHLKMIEELAYKLSCMICVYVGKPEGQGTWKINPDEGQIFGQGDVVVRIANSGSHFECITSDDVFTYKPKTMTADKAFRLQAEVFQQLGR